jgi:hypothetical protein
MKYSPFLCATMGTLHTIFSMTELTIIWTFELATNQFSYFLSLIFSTLLFHYHLLDIP